MRAFDMDTEVVSELIALRRDLHAHPELGLEEVRTSGIVAGELARCGYSVMRGLARTGVIATLSNGSSRRSLGLRADMDALPILEATGLPYSSKAPGIMHACGHDGHTSMLIGAARMIAERKCFDGTVHLIFQPAEENAGGAKIMVDEGLFLRFPCDAVFALHNEPQLPLGTFAFRDGAIMAAVDEARVTILGKGGHSSAPNLAADPIVAGASIIMALQTIVSRNLDPLESAVITVGAFHSGTASNIIPENAELVIDIRSFEPHVRDELERRIRIVCERQAQVYGLEARVDYIRSYDATINSKAETDILRKVARAFAGPDRVMELSRPDMGSEDFCYMLNQCPGSYFYLGVGDTPARMPLHHPSYDFNDDLIPIGSAFWTNLVESYLRCS